jgi:hypothetical protein
VARELMSRVGATLSVLIIFSGVAAVAEAHKVFIPELRKLPPSLLSQS